MPRLTDTGYCDEWVSYRTPSAARQAAAQKRCPFDLGQIEEWNDEMWIEWGSSLAISPPKLPSNLEMLAVSRFRRREDTIAQNVQAFINNFDDFLRELESWQHN